MRFFSLRLPRVRATACLCGRPLRLPLSSRCLTTTSSSISLSAIQVLANHAYSCNSLTRGSSRLMISLLVSKVGRIKLGSQGLEVSAQGLGCYNMSGGYGSPKPEPDNIALIHHAIHSGVTFLDTSDIYGPHTNEILLGKVFVGLGVNFFGQTLKGGVRDKVVNWPPNSESALSN